MNFIFYYLYSLPNDSVGLDTILVDTAETVPGLIPALLFFVYFIIVLGGTARQKARTGVADFPLWSVVGSIGVWIIALIISVKQGLIRLDWLAIIISITILSGIWLFLDRKQSEM